jgi:hypothetical protein
VFLSCNATSFPNYVDLSTPMNNLCSSNGDNSHLHEFPWQVYWLLPDFPRWNLLTWNTEWCWCASLEGDTVLLRGTINAEDIVSVPSAPDLPHTTLCIPPCACWLFCREINMVHGAWGLGVRSCRSSDHTVTLWSWNINAPAFSSTCGMFMRLPLPLTFPPFLRALWQD